MAQHVSKPFVATAIYALITVLAVLLVMADHPPPRDAIKVQEKCRTARWCW